jgi:hypothetical protein
MNTVYERYYFSLGRLLLFLLGLYIAFLALCTARPLVGVIFRLTGDVVVVRAVYLSGLLTLWRLTPIQNIKFGPCPISGVIEFFKTSQATQNSWHQKCDREQVRDWGPTSIRRHHTKLSRPGWLAPFPHLYIKISGWISDHKFPKAHCFWKIIRLRPFVLLVRITWRWVWGTGGVILTGESRSARRKICSRFTVSTINIAWTCLGSKPDVRCKRQVQATNRLRHARPDLVRLF